jgi:hypothetical protein
MDGIFNVLIVTLASGYYIRFNLFYFEHSSKKLLSQRVLFTSIVSGVVLTILIALLRYSVNLLHPEIINKIHSWFYSHSDLPNIPFALTTLAAFVIFYCGTRLLNWCYLKGYLYWLIEEGIFKEPHKKAIKKHGNELDNFLLAAYENLNELQITLKNGKVYIGYCSALPDVGGTNYISILPTMSGYRDKLTHQFYTTTDYTSTYMQYWRDDIANADLNDTTIIITQSEIVSVSNYYDEVRDAFIKEHSDFILEKDD